MCSIVVWLSIQLPALCEQSLHNWRHAYPDCIQTFENMSVRFYKTLVSSTHQIIWSIGNPTLANFCHSFNSQVSNSQVNQLWQIECQWFNSPLIKSQVSTLSHIVFKWIRSQVINSQVNISAMPVDPYVKDLCKAHHFFLLSSRRTVAVNVSTLLCAVKIIICVRCINCACSTI